MRIRFDVIMAALGLVAYLASCSWTQIENNNQQAQGITQSTPVASPSPGPECALAAIQPGTAGDSREIAQGGSLAIGVSLFGPQGLPLVPSCLSQYVATWETLSGPCTFVGGHDGVASAPSGAAIGATCTGGVNVGTVSGRLSLVVVAP